MLTLRRTAIARMRPSPLLRFGSDQFPDREELAARLIPLATMPLEPPRLRLASPDAAQRFVSGVPQSTTTSVEHGYCTVIDSEERLLGVGEVADGVIQPRVVLAPRFG